MQAVLKINEKELRPCEHAIGIAKTCRQLTKYYYSDLKERASKLVSSMDKEVLESIQSKILEYYLFIALFCC